MRSNVAELDTFVGQAIASENEDPKIAVGQIQSSVAGLRFANAHKRQEAVAVRRKVIDSYKQDAQALTAKYAAYEVKPLAIIPKAVWKRIITETGLYTFKPDSQNRVVVETDSLRYYEWGAAVMDALFWVGLWGLYFAFTVTQVDWAFGGTFGNVFTVCFGFAMAVAYIVCVRLTDPNPFIQLHGWFTHLLLRCADWMPHSWKMRRLLPDRRGIDSDEHKDHKATLVLPTPPDDVVKTLSRISHLHGMRLAVVAGGFAFAEPFSNLLDKELDRRVEDREYRWSLANFDPIVYDVHFNAVAIIAQFGDFPVEKEIIERICAEPEYLF